jgi:nitroreductase
MNESRSTEEVLTFLRSLRSVRRYASTTVSDVVIQDILEVGRWTGSAKNTQPWEFLVVRDREVLRELSTLGQFADHLAGAAFAIALIMASPLNAFDAGRLAEHVMLAGWAHGVGSCIASIFPEGNETRAKALLGVPPERAMRTTIAFGYPADQGALRIQTSPERRSVLPSIGRKPLSEIAYLDRYGQPWRSIE